MTRIEVITVDEGDLYQTIRSGIRLDGVDLPLDKASANVNEKSEGELRVRAIFWDVALGDRASRVPLEEIDAEIDEIIIPLERDKYFHRFRASFFLAEGSLADITLYVDIGSAHWKKPWSIQEYKIELRDVFEEVIKFGEITVHLDEQDAFLNSDFEMFFPGDNPGKTLQEGMEALWPKLEEVFELTDVRLKALIGDSSLVIPFDFPQEIRTSCEQYLLYFADFLRDVGVDVSTDLEHEKGNPGKVLFSVTPVAGKDALDKVRQSLELYLGLAQAPNMTPDFSTSIEVQRMQSEILSFQSRLMLAHAQIQQKEAALGLKDALIEQITARAVFAEAQVTAKKPKDEDRKVALFKGIIHLKRYDAKIADIDLPRLYDVFTEWFADESSTGNLAMYAKSKGLELPESSAPALPPASSDDAKRAV